MTIEAVGRFHFAPEQREAVLLLIHESLRIVRERDVGTLQYKWWMADDGTEVVVREAYVDSGALMAHAANVAGVLGDLQRFATARMEIYGDPSPELLILLRDMGVPIFHPLDAM